MNFVIKPARASVDETTSVIWFDNTACAYEYVSRPAKNSGENRFSELT